MASPERWFYVVGGEQKGPITVAELRALAQQKIINADTKVVREGSTHAISAAHLLSPDGATKWLLPVGRSGWAIAAGYLGLASFFPYMGLLAIAISIVAMLDLKKHPDKSGWGRVIFGIAMGAVSSALYAYVLLMKK